MMNKVIASIVVLAFLGSTATNLSGQRDLPSEEVQVIKNFEARLADADRLSMKPTPPPFDTTQLEYDFEISQRSLPYDYTPPPIRALSVPRSPELKKYDGYLRGGYGWPSSPLAKGNYTFDQGGPFRAGIDGSYYSVDNRSQLEHQFIGQGNVKGNAEYMISEGLKVFSGFDYTYQANDLYGYDHAVDTFSDLEAERRFHIIDAKIGASNPTRIADRFDYSAKLGYSNLQESQISQEESYQYDASLKYWVNGKHPVELKSGGVFSEYTDSVSRGVHRYFLTPTFTYRGDQWKAKAGFQFAAGGDRELFYPEASLTVRLLKDYLIAEIGVNGELEPLNFRRLVQLNPYFQNSPDSFYNSSRLKYYLTAKGDFAGLRYQLEGNYQQLDNLPVFQSMNIDRRFFAADFATGNITTLALSAQYEIVSNLEAKLDLTQRFYSLDSLEDAFHYPEFTLDFGLQYGLFDQDLQIWLETRYQSGVPYLNPTNEVENLDALFDVSVGVDYFFTEKFGLFVNAYNLTDNMRQRWVGYPVIGRNILGGVLVKF